MKTTGIFTIHSYEIPFDDFGETIYLFPFGDIHRHAPLCDVERWHDFCRWAETKSPAYFVGMGDYDDLASTTERELLSSKRFHESTLKTLDTLYKKHTKELAEELSFTRGRLVGLLNGNHYADLSSGINTDMLLADYLNATFLGVSSFIRLSFQPKKRGKRIRKSLDLFLHHGRSSGRLAGGTINSVEKMMDIAEADIYVCGHDHQKGVRPVEKLRLSGGGGSVKLSKRKIILARSGSFLKGYVPGEPSYIVDSAARPSDLGVTKIEITPRRIRTNGADDFEFDIHASI